MHPKTVPALWLSLVMTDILMCAASLLFEREKRYRHLLGSVGFSPQLSCSVQSPVLCVDFQSPPLGSLASWLVYHLMTGRRKALKMDMAAPWGWGSVCRSTLCPELYEGHSTLPPPLAASGIVRLYWLLEQRGVNYSKCQVFGRLIITYLQGCTSLLWNPEGKLHARSWSPCRWTL